LKNIQNETSTFQMATLLATVSITTWQAKVGFSAIS